MQDAKVEIQQWGAAHFGCAAEAVTQKFKLTARYLTLGPVAQLSAALP